MVIVVVLVLVGMMVEVVLVMDVELIEVVVVAVVSDGDGEWVVETDVGVEAAVDGGRDETGGNCGSGLSDSGLEIDIGGVVGDVIDVFGSIGGLGISESGGDDWCVGETGFGSRMLETGVRLIDAVIDVDDVESREDLFLSGAMGTARETGGSTSLLSTSLTPPRVS